MRNGYLALLPRDLQELVSSIEEASGIEIDVKVDHLRAGRNRGEPVPLACDVNESAAVLLLPSPGHFPEGSVLHELLHIQRFLVDGIPQISVCEDQFNPDLETTFVHWDNSLEHLVIVPKELELRPARREHWVAVIRRLINSIGTAQTKIARDYSALYSEFFAQHVLQDGMLEGEAAAIVHALGLEGDAPQFNNRLLSSLSSKEAVVRACVEHFGLDPNLVCLEYLDPKDGTCRHSALQ